MKAVALSPFLKLMKLSLSPLNFSFKMRKDFQLCLSFFPSFENLAIFKRHIVQNSTWLLILLCYFLFIKEKKVKNKKTKPQLRRHPPPFGGHARTFSRVR